MGSWSHREGDRPDPATDQGLHRSEVRGLEKIPPGAALVVSNHSGGIFAMDVPVLATDYYERYGYNRPIVTLGFDLLFVGPTADFFRRTGFIPASRRNADEALRSGGLVVVFPGGRHDIDRPSFARNKMTLAAVTATWGPPSTRVCPSSRSSRWGQETGYTWPWTKWQSCGAG